MNNSTASKNIKDTMRLGILCSMADGYTMIPFYVFSCLASLHPDRIWFFVPLVLVYTVERAWLVSLRGFGEIKNPYRIMKFGLYLAFIGSLVMAFYSMNEVLLIIGALLVGIGLAPYGAMFSPMAQQLKEKYPSFSKGSTLGTVIYLVMIILVITLGSTVFFTVAAAFCAYLLIVLLAFRSFREEDYYTEPRAFDETKRNNIYFLYGFLTLLCLLVLRQYKETGLSHLVWLAPLITIVSIIIENARNGKNRPAFAYRTYWAGALSSFMILFNLFYQASVSERSVALLIYPAICVGSLLSPTALKLLKKLMPGRPYDSVSSILAAACAFLCAVANPVVNIAGIVLSTAFAGIVESDSRDAYMKDERYVPLERALVSKRIFNSGGVINQVVLLFSIYILGKCFADEDLMYAESSGTPVEKMRFLLSVAGLICCTALLISAILIAVYSKKHENNNEKEVSQNG